jgi:hypothetical protein
MFLQGLRGFSIKFEKGGTLLIRDREAWLEFHELWTLASGLLSRTGPSREQRTGGTAYQWSSLEPSDRRRKSTVPFWKLGSTVPL